MAKENKFGNAMQALVKILREEPGRHEVDNIIKRASEIGEWKYLEGIRLGIRALVAAGVVKPNFNGKEISLAPPMPGANGAPAGPANNEEQDRKMREALQKAEDARKLWEGSREQLLKQRDEAIAKIGKATAIHEVRIIDKDDKVVRSVKAAFHAMFPKVLALAKARKNIFIYGPTGCGKTHLASQLAKVLGLSFGFVSCSAGMSEGKLEGRLLPIGKGGAFEYIISEFIKAYEQGGVFLLDEIDAADPNVLLLINAALANGHVAVPNRPANPYATRHKDFICIAAANTVGTGADRQYSGRNKLDAATLDRFQIGKVMMDYDLNVEAELCPDSYLRTRLQRYRNNVRAHKLERAISTRFLKDAYEMKQLAGWTDSDIDTALFTGWREDEINKVKGH